MGSAFPVIADCVTVQKEELVTNIRTVVELLGTFLFSKNLFSWKVHYLNALWRSDYGFVANPVEFVCFAVSKPY